MTQRNARHTRNQSHFASREQLLFHWSAC